MKKRYAILFLFFLSCNRAEIGSTVKPSDIDNRDSISVQQFFDMARATKKLMDSHASMSTDQDKRMVRIYNTISTSAELGDSPLNSDHILDSFLQSFNKTFYWMLIKKYDRRITKGGTEYLSKIDLFIGMGYEYRSEDFYTVY